MQFDCVWKTYEYYALVLVEVIIKTIMVLNLFLKGWSSRVVGHRLSG